MTTSFFMKLSMIGVAVSIGIFYIEPTIGKIKDIQDSTLEYQKEIDKVSTVNAELRKKVSVMNSVSLEKMNALDIYFPVQVDDIAVTKDLTIMAERTGVSITKVTFEPTYAAPEEAVEAEVTYDEYGNPIDTAALEEAVTFVEHTFKIAVAGRYADFKSFLDLMSQNHYPLAIKTLSVKPGESDVINGDIEVITYSREARPPATEEEVN